MKETHSRLTVVELVYHHPVDSPTTGEDNRFAYILESDESPYKGSRPTFMVGESWQPLDAGWLTNHTGMILITNREKRITSLRPLPAEIEEAANRTLEIGIEISPEVLPILQVLSGHSQRLLPLINFNTLRLRSRRGVIKCSVVVYPR